MPTVTLKGLPDDLYQRLKRRASANRRSLNGEILYMLERGVASADQAEATLARLAAFRERLAAEGVVLDPTLLERARREGRP